MKLETIESMFPRIFMDNDEASEEENELRMSSIRDLRELVVILPAVLGRLNQYPTGIVFLNHAK